jgi:uncharacterized protein (DUF1015 family)
MTDSLDESGVNLVGVAADPEAYDDAPVGLYVYRQRGGEASYTGVVCEVAVQAIAEGRVRGHEAVHTQRVEALVWHHATTQTPPALVTLLHRAGSAFTQAVGAAQDSPPLLDFTGPHGLQQRVWRVAEGAATTALTEELGAADFYIADGHHRAAAALEEWRQAGKPAGAGLLCVIHPIDGLRLSAFHRRVSGPVQADQLIGLLAPEFLAREVFRPPTPQVGALGLYVGRRWFVLDYQGTRGDGPLGLDVTILQSRVLDRLPAAMTGRERIIEAVPARTPLDQLTQRCDADEGALFTLAPPSMDSLTRLADNGEVMPPKTTFFEPKPCAGIFIPL